jgi:hypothetical protein
MQINDVLYMCVHETHKKAMSVKVYDNKMTKSDLWADFGLNRMKLDGGIEQEIAITQYPIRIK